MIRERSRAGGNRQDCKTSSRPCTGQRWGTRYSRTSLVRKSLTSSRCTRNRGALWRGILDRRLGAMRWIRSISVPVTVDGQTLWAIAISTMAHPDPVRVTVSGSPRFRSLTNINMLWQLRTGDPAIPAELYNDRNPVICPVGPPPVYIEPANWNRQIQPCYCQTSAIMDIFD